MKKIDKYDAIIFISLLSILLTICITMYKINMAYHEMTEKIFNAYIEATK